MTVMEDRYSSYGAVLIIGHARLDNIERLIHEALNAGMTRIYLHLDSGKHFELMQMQQDFCRKLRIKFGQSLTIQCTKENSGVARSVYMAIDWFFSQEKLGIILEDDLVVTSNTFEFFRVALPVMDSVPKCLLVSGSTFLKEDSIEVNNEIRWTNFPLIWGWATTSDNWKILKGLIVQPVPRKWFVSRVRGFLSIGAFRALTGAVDTWDSPIALGMWINNYLCMVPPHNTITNIGSDALAVHTKSKEFPIGNPIKLFDVSGINFVRPSSDNIKETNQMIMSQNYRIQIRHVVAPLMIRLSTADQGALRRRITDGN